MSILTLVGVACYLLVGFALAFGFWTIDATGFEGLVLIALAYLMVQHS
jgi:hypothetical protein